MLKEVKEFVEDPRKWQGENLGLGLLPLESKFLARSWLYCQLIKVSRQAVDPDCPGYLNKMSTVVGTLDNTFISYYVLNYKVWC